MKTVSSAAGGGWRDDAGTIVDPQAAEGQIEGGVVMGLGYGLTEDFPVENGYPLLNYGTGWGLCGPPMFRRWM